MDGHNSYHSHLLNIYHVSCPVVTPDVSNLITFFLHLYEALILVLNLLKMIEQRRLEIKEHKRWKNFDLNSSILSYPI